VVLIWIFSQSMNGAAGGVGDCCAPRAVNSTAEVASKTDAIRFISRPP
jgi:hypothetical protein